MQPHISTQKGTSLLSLLICTSLITIIALGFGKTFASTVKLFHKQQKAYDSWYAAELLEQLLKKGLRELDYHQLPVLPRIHQKAIWLQGSTVPLKQTENKDPDSPAITFTELAPQDRLYITARNQHSWTACSTKDTSLSNIRSILAVGATEITEMKIIHFKKKEKNCYDLQLFAPVLSMVGTQHASDVRYLVPIQRIYTILRSKKGELRYLSHLGAELLENQPILEHCPKYRLSMTRASGYAINKLTFKPESNFEPLNKTRIFYNQIARIPLPDWSLN